MRIGEAARTSGVSPRALRFYEHEGLIVPGRRSNGYRDYCTSTINRVHAIRSLLELGLPVRLVREILPHAVGGTGPAPERLCAEVLAEVQRYRDRLAARIAALDSRRTTLDEFLCRAARSSGASSA
ncbi:MAG TPA: MerR family transcriptional regulator [Nocardioides sp.]|nr:MerR family transcriptional regulator [Nocardioides sp.]